MAKAREKKWKTNLSKILADLSKDQLRMFLQCMEKITRCKKEDHSIEDMPQTIIECYGLEKSISAVQKALKRIPRNDAAVQTLLQPFLQSKSDKTTIVSEMKRKRRVEPTMKEDGRSADQLQSHQSEKENQLPPWRQTINDLQINGLQEKKSIAGLVVQKSTLRTYTTKKVKKFYFYMGVADETDAIKVIVFQKDLHKEIQEGSFFLFRDVIKDGTVLKVTSCSKVSKTSQLVVPEELKLEAQLLVNPQRPVFSIAKIQGSPDKTAVSVEGTVKEIGLVEKVKMRAKRTNKDVQDFTLEDGSGSIRIRLWGNDILHLRGISVGDFVRVLNMRSNHFKDKVSLNSTHFTKISKVQSAAAQNVTIDIFAIPNCNTMATNLEVYLNDDIQTFVVDSACLAEALGVTVIRDLEKVLIQKMPFQAQAEIQGSKINRIKLA